MAQLWLQPHLFLCFWIVIYTRLLHRCLRIKKRCKNIPNPVKKKKKHKIKTKQKVFGMKISMLDWNLQDFLISAWSFLRAWQMLPTFSWNDTQKVSVWLKKGDTVAISCWKSWAEARLCKSDDIHCESWQKNMCSSLKRVPREGKKREGGNPWCRHACTLFYLRLSSPSRSVKASVGTGGRACIAGVSLSVPLLIYTCAHTHTGRVKALLNTLWQMTNLDNAHVWAP